MCMFYHNGTFPQHSHNTSGVPDSFKSALLTIKGGCKGNHVQYWLLSPGIRRQSEGYCSKQLTWLQCTEPIYKMHVFGAHTHDNAAGALTKLRSITTKYTWRAIFCPSICPLVWIVNKLLHEHVCPPVKVVI